MHKNTKQCGLLLNDTIIRNQSVSSCSMKSNVISHVMNKKKISLGRIASSNQVRHNAQIAKRHGLLLTSSGNKINLTQIQSNRIESNQIKLNYSLSRRSVALLSCFFLSQQETRRAKKTKTKNTKHRSLLLCRRLAWLCSPG